MRKRTWFIIVMIILVVGVGYVTYSLLNHTGADYLTVSDLRSQAESIYGQQVTVTGQIAPGSVDWDEKEETIRFVLTDDGEKLPVVYQGIVPDSFEPGSDLVAEGKYRPDGVFEALRLSRQRSFCTFCH